MTKADLKEEEKQEKSQENLKEKKQKQLKGTTEKNTQNKEEKQDFQQLIYCGPNIGLKVSKNTVYIGGIPKVIEKEMSECEQLKKLFVPIVKYAETKEQIKEEGTVENLYYRAVESYLKEKGV